MEQQASSINLKVMELNRSPYAKNQQDKTLQDIADDALQQCTDLRNRPYGTCTTSLTTRSSSAPTSGTGPTVRVHARARAC